jgi:hypothetical protein
LHKTTPARGEVVHKFGLAKPQAIELDQIHVGAQARRYSAAVAKAKKGSSWNRVGDLFD